MSLIFRLWSQDYATGTKISLWFGRRMYHVQISDKTMSLHNTRLSTQHPIQYVMGGGGAKVNLTTHFHTMPKLKMQ